MSDEARIEARSDYASQEFVLAKGESIAVDDAYEAARLLRDAPGVLAPNKAAKDLVKKAGLQAPGVTGALPEPTSGKPDAEALTKDELEHLAEANGLDVQRAEGDGDPLKADYVRAVRAAGLAE